MRRQNRYNPRGIYRNHRGELIDKWGRVRQTDWDLYDKKRRTAEQVAAGEFPAHKVLNPLICST